MTSIVSFVVLASVSIVVFDGAASVISKLTRLPYGSFASGSFLIYVLLGFLGGREFSVLPVAISVGFAGLVESTVGWWLSWVIGPGQLPGGRRPTPGELTKIVIRVSSIALALGATGALVAGGL